MTSPHEAPVITYDQLHKAGACRSQLALFKRKFGQQVEVRVETGVSVADQFDWQWAATNLLTATAWAEYDRVRLAAGAEYLRTTEAAWAEYNRALATAWAEYNRVRLAAWAEYDRVLAVAFCTAYINQEQAA